MKFNIEKALEALESRNKVHRDVRFLKSHELTLGITSQDHLNKITELADLLIYNLFQNNDNQKNKELIYHDPIIRHDSVRVGVLPILPDQRFYAVACDLMMYGLKFIERTDIPELNGVLKSYIKNYLSGKNFENIVETMEL